MIAGRAAAVGGILSARMADAPENTLDSRPYSDPARPRYLGLWVASILLLALFGGAGAVITDVLFRLVVGQ